MLVLLFRTVVELLQNRFQFLRDREAQMRRILDQGYALIGQIEKDVLHYRYLSTDEEELYYEIFKTAGFIWGRDFF